MLSITVLTLIVFAVTSCNEYENPRIETQVREQLETNTVVYLVRGGVTSPLTRGVEFHVIVIDSCEYLISSYYGYGGNGSYGYMSHKGNCKYCAERRKKGK